MFTTNEYQAPYCPSTPWIYNADSNYHSLLGYISSLIHMRSKLLVIRVDLGFRAHSQGSHNAEYAREQFNRFMNNRRRNSIFANEIGYAWALEFGNNGQMKSSGKGFHYHCIFFFDGHKSNHDIMIGHQIGEYWMNTIADGTGVYYNSNKDKEELRRKGCPVGIGMTHRNNPEEVAAMTYMATYLLKEESNIQQFLPEHLRRFRTFGRGEF